MTHARNLCVLGFTLALAITEVRSNEATDILRKGDAEANGLGPRAAQQVAIDSDLSSDTHAATIALLQFFYHKETRIDELSCSEF